MKKRKYLKIAQLVCMREDWVVDIQTGVMIGLSMRFLDMVVRHIGQTNIDLQGRINNMPRYIDADILKDLYQPIDGKDYNVNMAIIRANIDDIPTADVQEVKHGKWIPSIDKDGIYEEVCSECGYIEKYNIDPNNDNHPNYCPHCDAKMDGKD